MNININDIESFEDEGVIEEKKRKFTVSNKKKGYKKFKQLKETKSNGVQYPKKRKR
tara:strand:+ start:26906 stop:27073 length:168 start_codon:yes stop_codon:yes gene_type:complete